MTPDNHLPFNLEKALAGEPVVTRTGLKVKRLHLRKKLHSGVKFPLTGYIDTLTNSWTLSGLFLLPEFGNNHPLDLFMLKTTPDANNLCPTCRR